MTKVCPICNKEFVAEPHQRKYCSDECSKKAKHTQNISYYNHNRSKILKEQKEKRKQTTHNKTVYKRICKICGKEFETIYPQTLCCSVECRKERDLKRMKKYYWNNREKILKRNRKRYFENTVIKEYRRKNMDKIKPYYVKYANENPEKVKLIKEKQKAHKYKKSHGITEDYCMKHNDCLNCPYPYEVCLHE